MLARRFRTAILLISIVTMGVIATWSSVDAAIGFHSRPQAVTAKTKAITVRPWSSSGAVSSQYHVVARKKGYCWTGSDASNRKDAFRCFTGNFIHDPCFASPKGNKVACPTNAAKRDVEVITLTKPLPAPNRGGSPDTWLIKLGNGWLCSLDTGATFIVDGKRANFSCPNNVWGFGEPKTKNEPWTILTGPGTPNKKNVHLTSRTIRKAWF